MINKIAFTGRTNVPIIREPIVKASMYLGEQKSNGIDLLTKFLSESKEIRNPKNLFNDLAFEPAAVSYAKSHGQRLDVIVGN